MGYELARGTRDSKNYSGLAGVVNGSGTLRGLGLFESNQIRPINIGYIEREITLKQFLGDPKIQNTVYQDVVDSTRYRNNWCDQTLYNPFPGIRIQRRDGGYFTLNDTLRFRQDGHNEEACMYAIVSNNTLGLIIEGYSWTFNSHQLNGYRPGIPITHSLIKVTKTVTKKGTIEGFLAKLGPQTGEFAPLALKGDIVLITF